MFIKKVKEFDSLISLDIKQSYPLFCFISKKQKRNIQYPMTIFMMYF